MTVNKEAKNKAKLLLLEYGIRKVTLENLIYIIEAQGFEIIEYSQSDKSEAVWQVLASLHLTAYANSGKAFAYKCGRTKILFICEEMSANEKLYALAHEEGHIIFGHLCNGACDGNAVEEEYVANEFAHHLLNPPLWLQFATMIKTNKKKAVWILSLVLALAVIVTVAVSVVQSNYYYGEYYISSSGSKYHKKECMTIKDKTNTQRLTDKDFYSGKYDPCGICLPD